MSGRVGSITTPIITDGLVLNLDTANRASYPKTGTIWNDTINGNNGTLVNGPTFSEDGGGSIDFDGVNDKIIGTTSRLFTFGNGSIDTPFSLCAWIYIDSLTSGGPIIGKYRSYSPFRGEYNMGIFNEKLIMQCIDGTATIRVRQDSNNTLSTNRWYNVVGTYNGNSTDEGITLYIDGQVVASTGFGQDSQYIAMNRATDASELSIGVILDEGNLNFQNHFNGKIANTQIYNKELTPSEVLQNYNALKRRFGL